MDAKNAAKVDHIEHIQAKVSQVVVHRLDQLWRGESRSPGSVCAAPGSDFGHDEQIIGIRMQRLANQLIGDVRTVVVAGVDMVHTARHRFAQHGKRCLWVLRRTEYPGAGELHGAVAKPPCGAIPAEGECSRLMNSGDSRLLL